MSHLSAAKLARPCRHVTLRPSRTGRPSLKNKKSRALVVRRDDELTDRAITERMSSKRTLNGQNDQTVLLSVDQVVDGHREVEVER